MTKPRLYEHPLSPYAQKNKIALYEKGVDFEALMPPGIGSGSAAGEFLQSSPRAEVPAFVDGDLKIFESTIIQDYIEEKWAFPALMPQDPAARARVRMIEEIVDTHLEAINWGMGEIRFFKRAEGKLAEEMTAKAAAQTTRFFAWLDGQLGDAEWFTTEAEGHAFFGWADAAVVPHLNLSALHGFQPTDHPRLTAWLERANARDSVVRCREAALATVVGMEQVDTLIKSGRFRREYRDHRLEWMVKTGGIDIVTAGLKNQSIRFGDDFFMV